MARLGHRQWFQRELDVLMPNRGLRLVRDPHRLGLDLWCVERKLPPEVHAAELEELRLAGEERYHSALSEEFGMVQFDMAPEWQIVHICRSTTCDHNPPTMAMHEASCYREPSRNDIESLRRWLYEFKTYEASLAALKAEAKAKTDAVEAESNDFFKKELKSSHVFRQLVFSDAPKTIFKEKDKPLICRP